MKATGEEDMTSHEDPDEINQKGQYQPYIFVLPTAPIYTQSDLNNTGKKKSKSYNQMKATGEEDMIALEDPDEITKKGQCQTYPFQLHHFPIYAPILHL
jgi:hypothetical protein